VGHLRTFKYFPQRLLHYLAIFCKTLYRALAHFMRARADVAELVDARDLGSRILRCEGSSPFIRTMFAEGKTNTK
jgi:hypothetical protein